MVTNPEKSRFMNECIQIWSNLLIPIMLVIFIWFGYLISSTILIIGQVFIAIWIVADPHDPSNFLIFSVVLALQLQIYSSQGFFIIVSDKVFGRTGALNSSMIAVLSELFFTISKMWEPNITKAFNEYHKSTITFGLAGLCFVSLLAFWLVLQIHKRIRTLNAIQNEIEQDSEKRQSFSTRRTEEVALSYPETSKSISESPLGEMGGMTSSAIIMEAQSKMKRGIWD